MIDVLLALGASAALCGYPLLPEPVEDYLIPKAENKIYFLPVGVIDSTGQLDVFPLWLLEAPQLSPDDEKTLILKVRWEVDK